MLSRHVTQEKSDRCFRLDPEQNTPLLLKTYFFPRDLFLPLHSLSSFFILFDLPAIRLSPLCSASNLTVWIKQDLCEVIYDVWNARSSNHIYLVLIISPGERGLSSNSEQHGDAAAGGGRGETKDKVHLVLPRQEIRSLSSINRKLKRTTRLRAKHLQAVPRSSSSSPGRTSSPFETGAPTVLLDLHFKHKQTHFGDFFFKTHFCFVSFLFLKIF